MPEHPLLLFPTPAKANRSTKPPSFKRFHKPDLARQNSRISPMFNELQRVFNSRRVDIQQNMAGIDPEQALVIETIGSVEKFANAVKRIDGFEWLGELEIDEIDPDDDFYDESNPQKKLNGRLYLVMTNQQALVEMQSLWDRYQANPEMKFGHGLAKFRDVFLCLKNIRRWDIQDRLFETGIMTYWQEQLANAPDRYVTFETELWFRGNANQRNKSASHVRDLVQQLNGRILGSSIIEGIAYHALLAQLPANVIRSIVSDNSVELVKCENVMFFRPVGQMIVGDRLPEGEEETAIGEVGTLPTGEPTIALLDGMPLVNHKLLADRVIVDDPDNWQADYAAAERLHGTYMASLIIHGDLNDHDSPQSRPIYVRPIMKPFPWITSPRRECVPNDGLAVDLIHRAVRRIFEGENGDQPAAPNVKIINLSIGDSVRQFANSMSPIARLIDWLSVKYNVLFVVSAGNHPTPISLELSQNEFDALQPEELEATIIKALYRDITNRKLLSPAENINGLTIGATHLDSSNGPNVGSRFDPFISLLPSPISAFGSGYRRSIKPDLIFNGGKQCYRKPLPNSGPVTIEPSIFRTPPGNKVASPSNLPGELRTTSYSCGTSNATALISRAAGFCYDSLQQIFREQTAEIEPATCEIPLLKAMLVHGCSWGDMGDRISDVLSTSGNGRKLSGLISRWIGYGMPLINRVLDCTDQRATLLGFGQLSAGEANVFRLPLPPSLSSRSEWRRLTITLAWLSPISATTQRYRIASLWFETNINRLVPNRSNADWQAVRRGTVQHEVFEGTKAEPFLNGDTMEIKVNCIEDAGKIISPTAYGIVVSLEVSEGVNIAIYDEIRTRIMPAIPIQPTNSRSNR